VELKAGLQGLRDDHPVVGDVRGLGLFLGVELVMDRSERSPAADQAAYAANRMREEGILLSPDGPDHNVLKIKPPMCFNRKNAEMLVATLDQILREDPLNQ
jgi:4-aminobutyrate aminotransferase-like enzyme